MRCDRNKCFLKIEIGLSEVHALPVAAGINVVAMVFGIVLVRAECVRCH